MDPSETYLDFDSLPNADRSRVQEVEPLVPTPPPPPAVRASFAEYKRDGRNWITLVTGEYYPDILRDACVLYEPVLRQFGTLLRASESSIRRC